MNIYLIETKSPGAHIFSKWSIPRLGAILLGTILKLKGHNVKVYIEDLADLPDISNFDDADLIGMSLITATAPRAFQLAIALKERYKNHPKTIVFGGTHPTFLPNESLEYCDYVVRGEGEETLVELIDAISSGNDPHEINEELKKIEGLSWRNKCCGCITHNPPRKLLKDLSAAPIPDFSIVYKWAEKAKIMPMATSRGCPYACEFCSVVPMFGREYRFKSTARVLEEIEDAVKHNLHIMFVDDNFTANPKRTKELLREIIKRKIKIRWSAQVRAESAKDIELIELMRDAGCFAVHIGFESINPATLEIYKKKQSIQTTKDAIRVYKNFGIKIHGMFVLGSDADNIQTIRDTADFANKEEIESVQFMVYTPLPGTPLYHELAASKRIIHTDWRKYTCNYVVFKPLLMTVSELHVGTLKAMREFYTWKKLFGHLLDGNIFYAAVHFYGIKSLRKALAGSKIYLDSINH
jgi:radical SAM superfamily enzyme YgiQ (UPF0313 family)